MIGDRFVEIMNHFHLSQSELAKALSLTSAAIHKIRLGQSTPSYATLLTLVRQFNINYDWLMEGKGQMLRPVVNANRVGEGPTAFSAETSETDLQQRCMEQLIRSNTKLLKANWQLIINNAKLVTSNLTKVKI